MHTYLKGVVGRTECWAVARVRVGLTGGAGRTECRAGARVVVGLAGVVHLHTKVHVREEGLDRSINIGFMNDK